MLRKLSVLLFLTAILMAGCSGNGNGNANVSPFQPMVNTTNNDNNNKKYGTVYDEDNIADVSERNPNFVDINKKEHSLSNEVFLNKYRGIIRDDKNFEPGVIYVVGNTAYVNVTPERKYTQDDIDKLKRKLRKAVPRFKLNLNIKD